MRAKKTLNYEAPRIWGLAPEIYLALPEDRDRIQSPKCCVLKNKYDGVLDKDKKMNNV
jgi:hypothetical protein